MITWLATIKLDFISEKTWKKKQYNQKNKNKKAAERGRREQKMFLKTNTTKQYKYWADYNYEVRACGTMHTKTVWEHPCQHKTTIESALKIVVQDMKSSNMLAIRLLAQSWKPI